MELRFPEYDLCLIEERDGVRVRQHDNEYLARKWQLTTPVFDVIRQGIGHGLTCLWQENHPRSESGESNHISFSYTHESASWVFCIGEGAGAPNVRWITVSHKLKDLLADPALRAKLETGGGKNFSIAPDTLPRFLMRIDPAVVASLLRASRERRRATR